MPVTNVNYNSAVEYCSKKAIKTCGKMERNTMKKELDKSLAKMVHGPIRFINKLSPYIGGEASNIILNALGTGLVAPIFIKYNFLSKTDDDTRTYSALRQPISAALAIITQAGLIIPVDKIISKMSNKGEFDNNRHNKFAYQDKSYLEALVKKNHPLWSKEQITQTAEEIRADQFSKLVSGIKETNGISYYNSLSNKSVSLSPEEFKNIVQSTIKDMQKHTAEEVDRYGKEKLTNKIVRGEFYRANTNQAEDVLNGLLTQIKSASTEKDCRSIIKSTIKDLKARKVDKELILIVTEAGQRPDSQTIIDKIKDDLIKCKDFALCESAEAVKDKVKNSVASDVSRLKYEGSVLDDMAKMSAESINIRELQAKAKNIDGINFIHDVATKYTKNIEGSLKGLTARTGLIVGLLVLPISCYMLNYAYPRIMDTLFPELTNSKHVNEKDKFIKGCSDKNGEVRHD